MEALKEVSKSSLMSSQIRFGGVQALWSQGPRGSLGWGEARPSPLEGSVLLLSD